MSAEAVTADEVSGVKLVAAVHYYYYYYYSVLVGMYGNNYSREESAVLLRII